MEYNSSLPIYLQVADSIKRDIVTGKLSPGAKLPSVRDLAVEYTINPNTVSRVYKELEMEGICFTRRGMGTFVTEDARRSSEVKRRDGWYPDPGISGRDGAAWFFQDPKRSDFWKKNSLRNDKEYVEMILESREITKKYGSKTAVDQVSLQLETGLIYAMLGPNGSGKTTWMKMASGLVKPTGGEILYQGNPIGRESKKRLPTCPRSLIFIIGCQ